MLLPLVSPPFTTAIAMIFSFGPRGLITYELLGLKGVTVYGLASTLFIGNPDLLSRSRI